MMRPRFILNGLELEARRDIPEIRPEIVQREADSPRKAKRREKTEDEVAQERRAAEMELQRAREQEETQVRLREAQDREAAQAREAAMAQAQQEEKIQLAQRAVSIFRPEPEVTREPSLPRIPSPESVIPPFETPITALAPQAQANIIGLDLLDSAARLDPALEAGEAAKPFYLRRNVQIAAVAGAVGLLVLGLVVNRFMGRKSKVGVAAPYAISGLFGTKATKRRSAKKTRKARKGRR